MSPQRVDAIWRGSDFGIGPMLFYPKIPGSRQAPGGRCIAFEKYDGTNLHWDWNREVGWHSFGTRRDEFALSSHGIEAFVAAHAELAECDDLFQASLADPLQRVFAENPRYQSHEDLSVFTEFFGPASFAGRHKADDPKQLVVFDVSANGELLFPEQFVQDFGDLPSARVVYRGRLTGKFCDDVRSGKYDVQEGVVCKGGTVRTGLWMAKIKTYAYLQKLKAAFADHWEDYWE